MASLVERRGVRHLGPLARPLATSAPAPASAARSYSLPQPPPSPCEMAVLSRLRVALATMRGAVSTPARRVLNEARTDDEARAMSAAAIAACIHDEFTSVLRAFCDETGRHVLYGPLRRQRGLERWMHAVNLLPLLDMAQLAPAEKTALLLNLYNGLTIHAIVQHRRKVSSVLEIVSFWRVWAYDVGGLTYTLDELEHGLMRGNRGHPMDGAASFAPEDKRGMHVLPLDSRIHFALVCGARGCPTLRVYSGDCLDAELDTQMADYFSSLVTVNQARQSVVLPKVVHWYKDDFGANNREVVATLASLLTQGDVRAQLDALLGSGRTPTISYSPYDWSLNK